MRPIRSRHTSGVPGRRAQGGFMAARLVLALAAATGVTAAVSGPLAYQTYQARNRAVPATTTSVPSPRPNVLGSTTVRDTVPTTADLPATTRSAPGAPPDAEPGD